MRNAETTAMNGPLHRLIGEKVVLDFENIDSATQSFIHALLSDVIRVYKIDIMERISFKSCGQTIQKIIGIVVDYTQESA